MIVSRTSAEKLLGRRLLGLGDGKRSYYVLSSDGLKNLGGPYTKPAAKSRLRQVERFKNPKTSNQSVRSSGLKNVINSHFDRKNGRINNPRRSKVKDALAAEATRYKNFDNFARGYWDACARGVYWYAVDEKKFYIGEHERILIENGRFLVHCNPELALSGKNEGKKYVAELDVTRVPQDSIRVKRSPEGVKIRITGSPGSIKVTRVLDPGAAMSSWQWQLSLLPSSKEGLRKVWERAWKARNKADAIRAMRIKKEKEREEVRAERKRKKDISAAERHAKKKKDSVRRRKAAKEVIGARAREESKSKKSSSAPKEIPEKSGGGRRARRSKNPSSAIRKIRFDTNTPGVQ